MDLSITILDIIARGIPEALLMVFGVYAITNTPINKVKYINSSLMLCGMIFFIRMLPINFGVHTIIIIFMINIIIVSYNKINYMESIKATIAVLTAQFIFEGINIMLIVCIFGDIDTVFNNSINKVVSGIPSLIMLFLTVNFIYKRGKNKKLQ